jgi:hypothetical protein
MLGFFAQVAQTTEEFARRVSELADGARTAGVPAQATVCQSASDRLARLAFDSAHGAADYARVSEDATDCATALTEVSQGLDACDEDLAAQAAALAEQLRKLASDALSVTQPID